MNTWYKSIFTGNTEPVLLQISAAFTIACGIAGAPPSMAIFWSRGTNGDTVYFPPECESIARQFNAAACEKPLPDKTG